jgi:hypothetical protein
MLFNWLRNRVRDAVLEGVNDAAELLAQDGEDSPAPVVLRLALDRPALAAPDDTRAAEAQQSGKKRKQ